MLAFYKSLLGQQGKLFRKTIRSRAFDVAVSSEQFQGQKVNVYLERLPRQPRDRAFTAFLKGLPESSTEVLQAIAARLLEAPTSASRLLAAVVSRHPIDEAAAELECDTLPLEFFPRAFLQPIAEALVRRVGMGYVARWMEKPSVHIVVRHHRSRFCRMTLTPEGSARCSALCVRPRGRFLVRVAPNVMSSKPNSCNTTRQSRGRMYVLKSAGPVRPT